MRKVFLVANEKALSKKRQKGVSMVSLVITIIVMLILAAIIFLSSTNSIEQAGVGVFVRELSLVRQAASEKKLDNQIYGTSEENTYKGFYKTKIKNPPVTFVSFSETEIYGYVIDLDYIHAENAERGKDYKRFGTNIEENIVEFGKDDVYVLDKDGNVFYAKGFETDDGVHYSNTGIELYGPEIVSVNKTIAADQKSATISVEVKKEKNGTLNVKIGEKEATRTLISEDGLTETFELTVNENKTYVVVAEETGSGRSTASIDVTELNLVTYVIKYNPNGTNVINMPSDQTKTEKVSTNLSTRMPQRAGYTFLGWSENAYSEIATYRPGGEFIKDGSVANEVINLFAIWKLGKEEKYSVTYNANGGSNAPMGVENISGDYTITTQEPIREGFTFLGWSKNSKATTAEYSAGATITLTENVTLYAVWSKGTYTVTVTVYPEGAGTVTGNATKPEGVEVFVSTTKNPGYVFKNWTVKSGGVNLSNSTIPTTSFTMPKNSVELVANYEVEEYLVKFNANRGTGTPSAKEAKYGEEIEIPTMKPTRAGYDFMGWALKQDAKTATHQESQKYVVTQSVTFYAVWQVHIETYTLKFNLNGGFGNTNGEIGKFVDQTKTKGGQLVIPIGGENEPYKEGFAFKGWALTADSTDVVLRPGDTYSRDANIEIFAVWKDETPPTITLEPKQEEHSDKVSIIASAYDAGKIIEYAWTMSSDYPTAWQTEGISGEHVTSEREINQKGSHYFWAKDLAGNYTYQVMNAYEVKYDGMGGNNTPETQYQLQNTDLTLTKNVPTKERYAFLGWSIAANPGNTIADVNFQKGAKFNVNADTVLKAVWGEAFFGLSAKNVVTQIDGQNVEITVTKSAYTGEISVTSSDTDIATVNLSGNIITIVPGTKIGETEITVVESMVGTTEKIVVTVERGIRKVNIDRTEQRFTYGDSNSSIDFTYNGKTTSLSTTTSNATVATATVSGRTLTINPDNYGTAMIGLVFAQDDQYLEKTVEVTVIVGKKQIIVTPNSNQSKPYDGTISTPRLTYTYAGSMAGEVPKFNGELDRETGADVGKYEIKLGGLSLLNNDNFLIENYELVFSSTKVYFEITPKRIIAPIANTPQQYDGTAKEGIAAGEDYVRGGEYQKTNAGNYTAIATLKDSKNFVWDDTNATNARNIGWEITSLDLRASEAKIDPIPNYTYTGYEIKPLPVVTCKGVELVNGTDYTVSYANNINVGYATVTVSGKGNYRGVIEKDFEITKATMQVDAIGYSGTFDNKEHSIKVSPIWPSSGYTIYYSETQLTSSNCTTGVSTPPKYTTPTDITTYYYIKAPNFNDYSGSASVKITPKDIGGNISILGVTDKSYTGNEITQIITVRDNEQNRNLVENAEYSIAYANNIKVGTATITITGIGNYKGTKTTTFNILGDVITISRNTEQLVTEIEVTITKTLPVGTLQYRINNGAWKNYTGKFKITEDCTIYAQSVHNGDVIGTSQLLITNICEHDYTVATCTEDSVCKHCGLFNSGKLGHEYTSETPTVDYLITDANCTDAAVYFHKCIRCTAKGTTTYSYGNPLGHEFTSKTATAVYLKTAATCTEKAVYYHKCIRCTAKGTTTYSYGNPLGHEFTKKEATAAYLKSEATCTIAATYYYKCTRCDAKGTNTYTVGEPAGHDFTVQIINGTYLASAATCTKPAQYYYKCSKCDAKSTETYQYGEPTGHSYGSFIILAEPNCIQTGTQRKTCKNCGTSVTEEIAIDPTNHVGPITYEDTVPATCTTTGTRKHTCTACNNVVKFETIAELGHEWNAPAAPRKCNRCGLEELIYAQAIYTQGNQTLSFVNSKQYNVGDTFNGQIVTAVYNNIDTTAYLVQRDIPWNNYASVITKVQFLHEITPISTAYWFDGFSNCNNFGDLTKLKTSKVNTMSSMFGDCSSLTSLDIRSWDTTSLKNVRMMFSGCTALSSLNLSNFKLSGITSTQYMFYTCRSLTSLDLSGWDTSKVSDMSYMFANCSNLQSITGLTEWDTQNVTTMQQMFQNCSKLTAIGDLSTKTVTRANGSTYTAWNTSKVTNISSMFNNCYLLETINVSNWNTDAITKMYAVFSGCKALKSLDLSSWNNHNVTNDQDLFYECYKLERVSLGNKFEFVSAGAYLPTPNSSYITGADGKWYDISTGTGYTPANIPSDKAATYVAVPQTYTYNVEYKSTSGVSLGSDTVTKVKGTTNTINAKTFTGYNTPSSKTVTWDTATKTITFTYTPTSYSITINCDGGSGVSSMSYTIETATFTIGTPTKSGCVFDGWTDENGVTYASVTIEKGSYGAKKYTAKWKVSGDIPIFTYYKPGTTTPASYQIVDYNDNVIPNPDTYVGDWKIRFLESGTLTITELRSAATGIDAFLVGGGGSGYRRAGGGGGYTKTQKGIAVAANTSYSIIVGAGGTGGNGQASKAFSITANGGKQPDTSGVPIGGAGGSGGGGRSDGGGDGGAGGSNGSNGGSSYTAGGKGQGTTTREFGESTGKLYAGGGGGGGSGGGAAGAAGAGGGGAGTAGGSGAKGGNGKANTGGGGGGSQDSNGTASTGGSGIVIIRNSSLITFTIDGTSYTSPKIYTWEEWIGSSYNTSRYAKSSASATSYYMTNSAKVGLTYNTSSKIYCELKDKPEHGVQYTTINNSNIPKFTYSGAYQLVDDNDNAVTSSTVNWKIRFLTSGQFKTTALGNANNGIDAFLVGGGGSGYRRAGGGGGYTKTETRISIANNTGYDIVIGAGGTGGDGQASKAFTFTANGGKQPDTSGVPIGGAGGSGGGGRSDGGGDGGAGGSDGSNGGSSYTAGGKGQGTTTREFGEDTGRLYAGGGGGGGSGGGAAGAAGAGGGGAGTAGGSGAQGGAGTPNTGGGGGGSQDSNGSPSLGGSGIVIIRNTRFVGGSSIPAFTYRGGIYEIVDDNDQKITDTENYTGNWKIRFLTTGTLNFTSLGSATDGIDLFLVGGGGGGTRWASAGGGGGYTASYGNITVELNKDYRITVGAGGEKGGTNGDNSGGTGGASAAFNKSVQGGQGAYGHSAIAGGQGGAGGSGGGSGYANSDPYYLTAGAGGSDGASGAGSWGGTGQGTSTREFWSIDRNRNAKIYAGGGGGNGLSNGNGNGKANTGGGGSGNSSGGGDGYSGIVIIRNKR